MNVFNMFQKRSSAPVARERLQILLAHERAARGAPDLLALLREEIIAVVTRHVPVGHENVNVTTHRNGDVSTLEINIDIPNSVKARVIVNA
jgi:cell division topological specificity factor